MELLLLSHLTDKETKAQKSEESCLRVYSHTVVEPGFEPVSLAPESMLISIISYRILLGQQEGPWSPVLPENRPGIQRHGNKISFSPSLEDLILCDRKHIQLLQVIPQGIVILPGEAKFLRN